MKKIFISLISVAMVLLCLCSCGKKEEAPAPAENTNSTSGIHHVEINVKDYGTIPFEEQPVIESVKVID